MMTVIRKVLKSKLAKNGIWLLLLQGFNTIIPMITIPYITRILSSSSYGEFSLSLNWIGYFQVIVEYGFALTGARKVAMRKNDSELSLIRSRIFVARLLLTLICGIIFIFVVLITEVNKTQLICMTILFIMVVMIVFQQTWFFQGMSEMKNIAIINALSRTISVILIFIFVKSSDDLYLYCFLYASNYIVAGVTGWIVVHRKYHVNMKKVYLGDIIKEIGEGWPLFISQAMIKIFGNFGVTILGIMATKTDVGIYSAINKIPLVMTLIFSVVGQVLYPQSCQAFSLSFNNGLKNIKKYGTPVFIFFSFISLMIIVFRSQIIRVIFGDEYARYSFLLVPFVLWVLNGILNNFLGIQTIVASGNQKKYSKALMISVIIMLGLMFTLSKPFKAYGIAISSMISEFVLTIMLAICIIQIRKNTGKD